MVAIGASMAAIVTAAIFMTAEHMLVAIPTLLFVVLGCSYAIWPFVDSAQELPVTEERAPPKKTINRPWSDIREISGPLHIRAQIPEDIIIELRPIKDSLNSSGASVGGLMVPEPIYRFGYHV